MDLQAGVDRWLKQAGHRHESGFWCRKRRPDPAPLGLVVEEVDSNPATSPSRQPKAARNRTRAIARYRVALSHVGRPALSHERGLPLSHVSCVWRYCTFATLSISGSQPQRLSIMALDA